MRIRSIITMGVLALLLARPAAAQAPQSKTHLAGKPSSMVTLWVSRASPGQTVGFGVLRSDGTNGPLTVPVGSVLVLTDLEVRAAYPGPGLREGGICIDVPGCGPCCSFPAFFGFDGPMQHIALTGGMVLSSPPFLFLDPSAGGTVQARAFGYFAKDK